MAEPRPFGAASDILTPVDDSTMAMAAMIESLRVQTKTTERVLDKVDNLSSAVAKVREEIALMHARDEKITELTGELKELQGKVSSIELLHAQQDGAAKFLTIMKEFGPWLLAVAAFFYSVLNTPR